MIHIIDNDGLECWKNDNNHYHREDGGPSYIDELGNEFWDQNGKSYRENNPAVIETSGHEAWYRNGIQIK